MYEARSNLRDFNSILDMAFSDQIRPSVVGSKRFRNLFLQAADHPMGYEDGFSGVDFQRAERRYGALSEEDLDELLDASKQVLNFVDSHSGLEGDIVREAFLGTNQMVQPVLYRSRWRSERAKRAEAIVERLTRNYLESEKEIKEWDAQFAENQSMVHMENLNEQQISIFTGLLGAIPTYLGLYLIDPELPKYVGENISLPLLVTGFATIMADQYMLLPMQEIGNSPNSSKELITNRHYSFLRHPMYSARMIGTSFVNLAYLNPLSFFYGAQGLYEGTEACINQDKKLRILHGEKAEDYQKRVPAVIPGTNLVNKVLEPLLPKRTFDFLQTPISKFLGKIPKVKTGLTNILREELKEPHEYRGTANTRISTSIAPPPWKKNLGILGESYAGAAYTLMTIPFMVAHKALNFKSAEKVAKIGYNLWGEETTNLPGFGLSKREDDVRKRSAKVQEMINSEQQEEKLAMVAKG